MQLRKNIITASFIPNTFFQFSPLLRELLLRMMEPTQHKRISLSEIISHKWFKTSSM